MYFLIFQPEHRLNLCLIFSDSQIINVMLIKKSADHNWTELANSYSLFRTFKKHYGHKNQCY